MKIIILVVQIILFQFYLYGQDFPNFIQVKEDESFQSILQKAAHVKPTKRQIEWQELEFTCFFHFGLNTFYNNEWGKKNYSPDAFNPTQLDIRQWARTVKEIGGKMMIMVAKHHDGFCYWQTKYTDFSVANSPWKNGKGDLIAEAAEACKEFGLKLGIYLSPWDIHSPVYGTDEYNQFFKNQLRELLTNYGKVFEVWFDGACGEGPNGKKQVYDWFGYYKLIHELQPEAVIAITGPDVRWVGTESGYGRETEWSVLPIHESTIEQITKSIKENEGEIFFTPTDYMYQPSIGGREQLKNAKGLIWYPSEVDVSIRPGWFYHEAEDTLVKTPEQLVDIYYSSVGRNSVLLLNFAPDKRGLIPDQDIRNAKKMKEIIDETFKINLASSAKIIAQHSNSNLSLFNLVDQDNKTYWTPGEGVTSTSLEFDLGEEKLFDRLILQENFRNGQRVEMFSLDAFFNNEWHEIAKGTTIGYKRLLRFNPVLSQKVRLNILLSRDHPEISTFGLFKSPPSR